MFSSQIVYSAHISWDKWSPKQWTEYWNVIISDKNDDSQMMSKTSEMRFRFETFRFTHLIPSLLCCFSDSLERSWNIYHIRYMDIICCHWNQWKDTRWLDKQSVRTSQFLFYVQPIWNEVIIWDSIICRLYRNILSNVNVNESKIKYNNKRDRDVCYFQNM